MHAKRFETARASARASVRGLLCIAACLAAGYPAAAKEPKPAPDDLSWLQKQADDGAVAYQSSKTGEVYLIEIADGKVQELGKGAFPEFSPDSSKLAWVRGDTAVGRMRAGDDTVHEIAEGIEAQGAMHWLGNDAVVVRFKQGGWHRVSLDGQRTPIDELNAMGFTGREADVKRCDDGVWVYTAGRQWMTSDGKSGRIPGNCSTSLSPDGRSIGALQPGHREFKYHAIREGGVGGKLRWVWAGPKKDKGFDNHRWSSNDPRFFVCEDEKHGQPAVMRVGDTHTVRLGKAHPGSDIYGDITIGSAKGGPWPKRAAGPATAPATSDEPDNPKPNVPAVTLDATLRMKSDLPDKDNYPNALVVYVYAVKKVTAGELPQGTDRVLVAHWAIRDGNVIKPIAQRRTGSDHTLTLESFDAHPDLATHQISLPGTDAVLDADLWFAVE